ncbi:MAG: OmpA family protein [Candidatus Kapaibacterium sp.]
MKLLEKLSIIVFLFTLTSITIFKVNAKPINSTYVRLLPIFFKANSSEIDTTVCLNESNMPTLLDAIKVKCNKVTLTIQGHCSSQEKKQPQLSKARAEAVKNWLIRNGVPSNRITGISVIGSKVDLVSEPRSKSARSVMDSKLLQLIEGKNRYVDFLMSEACSESD